MPSVTSLTSPRWLTCLQVIRGWDEGVAQMQLGEHAELEVTSDYGYGERGFPAWGVRAPLPLCPLPLGTVPCTPMGLGYSCCYSSHSPFCFAVLGQLSFRSACTPVCMSLRCLRGCMLLIQDVRP